MDEIYVQSQVYPNFEGYIINKNKSVARYEYNSSESINCHLGKSKMSTCACGGLSWELPWAALAELTVSLSNKKLPRTKNVRGSRDCR